MYTRCPRCHTVFAVTEQQLKAREGMVRCGRCRTVFQADLALFEEVPGGTPRPGSAPREEPQFGRDEGETLVIEPTAPPRKPVRRWPWIMIDLLLIGALCGQWIYAQRDRLAALPWIHPWAVQFCQTYACGLEVPQDLQAIEIQQTEIAAHPRYQHAIEVRTTLVNRARFAQPFPEIGLTLMTAAGQVVARATFSPREYGQGSGSLMPPNTAEPVDFGITRPAEVGPLSYELQVYPGPPVPQ